ncbi:MAG: hypothetical protein ACOZNI_30450 [Myxococcota bacterium]
MHTHIRAFRKEAKMARKGRVITGQKDTRTLKGLGAGALDEAARSRQEGRSEEESAFWVVARGAMEADAQSNHRRRDRARASREAGSLIDTVKTATDIFRTLTRK